MMRGQETEPTPALKRRVARADEDQDAAVVEPNRAAAGSRRGGGRQSCNRLSVNTPAVLLNNAGAGIEGTVNKSATGHDAAFTFKTGFSARALIGLLGNDDFGFKVSPDGSAFVVAVRIDRTNGRLELVEAVVLRAHDAVPSPPPVGKLALSARVPAGMGWLNVERLSGRHFPLKPNFGVIRRPTRQLRGRPGSSASAVTPAPVPCTSTSGQPGPGAMCSRRGPLPSPRSCRPRAKSCPKAAPCAGC